MRKERAGWATRGDFLYHWVVLALAVLFAVLPVAQAQENSKTGEQLRIRHGEDPSSTPLSEKPMILVKHDSPGTDHQNNSDVVKMIEGKSVKGRQLSKRAIKNYEEAYKLSESGNATKAKMKLEAGKNNQNKAKRIQKKIEHLKDSLLPNFKQKVQATIAGLASSIEAAKNKRASLKAVEALLAVEKNDVMTKIQDRIAECTKDDREGEYIGDFQLKFFGAEKLFEEDKFLSVGATAQLSFVKHNVNRSETSFNEPGAGVGVSIRYYPTSKITKGIDGNVLTIKNLKKKCRATKITDTSVYDNPKNGMMAFPSFSIDFIPFISKSGDEGDIAIQPALVFSFLNNLISVGAGINAVGPEKDRGDIFVLLGLGVCTDRVFA